MKRYLIIFVLLLPSFYLFAQESSILKSSKPIKSYKGKYDIMYYLVEDDELLVIHYKKNGLLLEKFNANTMEWITEQTYEFKKTYCIFERLFTLNGEHFLLYSTYNKSDRTDKLFYRKVDIKNCALLEEKLILKNDGEIPYTRINDDSQTSQKYVFSHHYDPNRYYFSYTQDSSKILIQHKKRPRQKLNHLNHEIMGMYVFDKMFNKIWGGAIEMPYLESDMKIKSYAVNQKGEGYIFIQNKPKQIFELLVFKDQKHIKTIPINHIDFHISNYQIIPNNNGDLVFIGYYKTKKRDLKAEGLFHFKLDNSYQIIQQKKYPIPLTIRQAYNPKDVPENLLSLNLETIYIDEKDDLLIIGESMSYYYLGEQSRPINQDILLTKINNTGKLEWMNKIPKLQYLYNGFISKKINNDYYILFLDNIKNVALPKTQAPTRFINKKNLCLLGYKVNSTDGDIKQKLLLTEGTIPVTKKKLLLLNNFTYFTRNPSHTQQFKVIPNSIVPGTIVKGAIPLF